MKIPKALIDEYFGTTKSLNESDIWIEGGLTDDIIKKLRDSRRSRKYIILEDGTKTTLEHPVKVVLIIDVNNVGTRLYMTDDDYDRSSNRSQFMQTKIECKVRSIELVSEKDELNEEK